MTIKKRIIRWTVGDGDDTSYARGFIFGDYGWSAAAYDALIAEAIKDFPFLTREIIEIGKVTQSTYMKGFKLVEFPLPNETTHQDYAEWDRFDFSR